MTMLALLLGYLGYSPPPLAVQLTQIPLILIFALLVVIVGTAGVLFYLSRGSGKIASTPRSPSASLALNTSLAVAFITLVLLSSLLQTPFIFFSPLAYMENGQTAFPEFYSFLPPFGLHVAFVLPPLFLVLVVRGVLKKIAAGIGAGTLLLLAYVFLIEAKSGAEWTILLTPYPLVLWGIIGVFVILLRYKHSTVAPLIFLAVATPLAIMQVSLYRDDLHGMRLRVYGHQARVGDYTDWKAMLQNCRALAGNRFPADGYGINCSLEVAHRKCGVGERPQETWTEAEGTCIREVQEEYYGKKIER